MHDICVFGGRFRPYHAGHHEVVLAGLEAAQYVFIVVGSTGEPINFRNPFTFEEVREMIRASLTPQQADRVFIFGVEDHDNDLLWVKAVQKIVAAQAKLLSFGRDPKIALIGHEKDGSSYYLKLFPQWDSVGVPNNTMLDATTIRDGLYTMPEDMVSSYPTSIKDMTGTNVLPFGTFLFLREWVNTPAFWRMRDEANFMSDYLKQFPQVPYPRYFTAADACVMQAGSTLLVRRGEMPGEGLWALPGGHVNMHETFYQAALRELGEETALYESIDPEIVKLALRGEKLLDNPWRSTRTRTVSVAYGFLLPGIDQPAVRGLDDARAARWWPNDEITRGMMFEDHFNVVEDFAARFRNIL